MCSVGLWILATYNIRFLILAKHDETLPKYNKVTTKCKSLLYAIVLQLTETAADEVILNNRLIDPVG